jgi:excisionase family DNA binding protein
MKIGTATDVAVLLKLNKQRVYELTRRGLLPGAFQIGERQIRYDLDALNGWIKQNSKAQPDEAQR